MAFIWKWFKRVLSFFVILIVITLAVGALRSTPMSPHPFTDTEDILVVAHRGGGGLWPENTLYAFEQSINIGVDVLEFDVHSTSDGIMVVMHDATVDRTTDGTGRIEDLSWAQLQRLNAGYQWSNEETTSYPYRDKGLKIPSFEEVLKAFPETKMNIELKSSKAGDIEQLLTLIDALHPLDLTIYASFRSEAHAYIRENNPEIATAATVGDTFFFWVLNAVYLGFSYNPQAHVFQVPPSIFDLPVVTQQFVDGAHGHNVDVHVWTINDKQEMQRLIDIGVDGIMTDYPDRLLSLLGRKFSQGMPTDSTSNIP
ncbi:MAG: glycerophosphodiester phosphodiesterase [Candidatus Latescibacteria bacterium]|jgi:glycerophosphoryl diester phosphodiesterase|nr:glycerophosphodiester phosphodiesterase [Candidatus Latescibacterota bacterium]